MAVNCTLPEPATTPSNAGVAGIGVILGFVVPAVVSIVLSLSLIIQESFIHSDRPALGVIRRKLLFGISDQQILYGMGIQIVGLAQINQLVPYHFFVIWMVSLLSTAIHNSTLLVLIGSFHSDRVLRWLRQVMMFINLALGCVFGVCMLQVVQKDLEHSTLPTACAWTLAPPPIDDAPSSSSSLSSSSSSSSSSMGAAADNSALSYVGTILAIAGNCLVFGAATWLLHDRRQRGFKWIQLAGIAMMTAVAVAATVRVIQESQAFGVAKTPLGDDGERQWSFATLVTLLMLALPLMTVLEIYRGEIHVHRDFEKHG